MVTPRSALFATCAPGVEPALHAEMRELRFAKLERQVGGVYFEGDDRDVWRANMEVRTAVRILRRMARFPASDREALYAGAREVPWEHFLPNDGTLAVLAHARDSSLFHTGFVAQVVKDAIVDRFRDRTGTRPSVDKESPDLSVRAHLVKDRCSLLLDTSGPSLHKRGWRCYQGRAPLAETTAAALLFLSGWDRRSPLIDPFCGSGTILIEAALLAAGLPPGATREAFAFEGWPDHDSAAFGAVRAKAREKRALPRKLQLIGMDEDARCIAGARDNLVALGLEDAVRFEVANARSFSPRPGWNGWIVTNPPYGERVGDPKALPALYREFGSRLKGSASGYHLALMTGSAPLADALRFPDLERRVLANGALECTLVSGEL